jgi:hypothetical protein
LNWDSNLNQSSVYGKTLSTPWRAANLVSSPASLTAQPRPNTTPPDATYRRAEHRRWQVGPAPRHDGVALTSPSSSLSLPLWLTAKAKARRAGRGLAVAARPASPSASQPSTCPRAARCYKSRHRDPRGSPNPSRLGGVHSPVRPPTRWRRRRSEGGRRRDWRRPWERRPPRRPEPPVRGAGPAVVKRTCLHCFHYFHSVAPPSSSSSSPPTSRATSLH